jgi:PPM family protein phosphatase
VSDSGLESGERAPGSGVRPMELPIEVTAATHIGRRKVNADAHLIDEAAGLFAVADGLGDTPRSPLVARMALDAVGELFKSWASKSPAGRYMWEARDRLELGVTQAHGRLYAPGRSREKRIGTTFAGVVVCAGWICAAHIGDSRVYLFRRGEDTLVGTVDHAIAGDAIHDGLPHERAAALPHAQAVTRMLGVSKCVEVKPMSWLWEPGDVLLLCTDGVSDRIELEELVSILRDVDDVGDAARQIVARAFEAGGWDNATAVVATWRGK